MRLVQFTYKNLVRRPTRSGLTIAGIAIAVAVVVCLVGAADSVFRSVLAIFLSRDVDLIVAQTGVVQRMQSNLDERLVKKIAALDGVKRVGAALAENFSYPDQDLLGIVVRGIEPGNLLLDDIAIVDGRNIHADDDKVLLLGKGLATTLKKGVGDKFEVSVGNSFTIVGIYESFSHLENYSMIMPLRALQDMMDRQGKVSVITIIAENHDAAALEPLAAKIREFGPNLEVLPTRGYVDSMVETRALRQAAWFISILALILGTIGMVNTMFTSVFERTGEIAVLRAVGWRKVSVVRMVLLESILICLIGAVLGTLFAIALMNVVSRLLPGKLLAGDIGAGVIAQGFAVALVVGVFGGLFPAIRAARMLPTEGLRHE